MKRVLTAAKKLLLRDTFISEGIVELKQIQLSEDTAKNAALFLLNPTSVPKDGLTVIPP